MNLDQILGNYLQPSTTPPSQAPEHFEQAAAAAPADEVSRGLAQAFRSENTPPFGEMVANLFRNSGPQQQAGLLNQILGSLGGGAAGGLLGSLAQQFGGAHVAPTDAANVTPEQVQEIATQAEKHNPGIVDRVSDFYAQHPTLVRTLGTVALSVALSHMAQRRAG